VIIDDWSDVLFVGWGGHEGLTHYRTVIPARSIGAEWAAFDHNIQASVHESTKDMHKVIVVQNCWNDWQYNLVRSMRRHGAKIILNVDDWIKAIGNMGDSHAFSASFGKKKLLDIHYKLLQFADGIIVSTPWLARRLASYSDNIVICRNMLDSKRYIVPPVENDLGVIIGWAGGTGHGDALRGISEPLSRVLRENPDTHFVMMGDDRRSLYRGSEKDRVHFIPWTALHLYPRDMTMFDIAVAPAANNDFYRAKSQLRYYEASMLGIPVVAHPMYDELRPGETGFIAQSPEDWYKYLTQLVKSAELRQYMSKNIHEQSKDFHMEARASEWSEGISHLVRDLPETYSVKEHRSVSDVLQEELGQEESTSTSQGRPTGLHGVPRSASDVGIGLKGV
jgi:glycosyltransferase involved in cell wall biosynthesis